MRKILGALLSAGCLSAVAWAGGPQGAPATVSSVAIDGLSLKVVLVWTDDAVFTPTQLVLRDEEGSVVAASAVAPQDGGEVVPLHEAFQGFGKRGLQYFLGVEDGTGAYSKGFPFYLALDCPYDNLCELRAVPGLYNEKAVVVEEVLDASFDTFGGSQDILADVLMRSPEQRGAVYGFSWQMNRRFPRGGASCSCIWLAVPATYKGPAGSVGAAHRIGVLPNPGDSMEYETWGESRLTLRLRCFRVTDDELISVAVGQTGEGLLLSQPRLKACAKPCSGYVTQSLTYEGDYLAEAGARSKASAEGTLVYEVGGTPVISSEAGAAAGGPAGPSQTAELNATYSTSAEQPQKAVLRSTAWVSATSGAPPSAVSRGAGSPGVGVDSENGTVGYSESNYQMIAEGTSSCAVQSSVTVILGHTWPPLDIGTTNITLIIGN